MIFIPARRKEHEFPNKILIYSLFAALFLLSPIASAATPPAGADSAALPSYADVADLVTASPLVIRARVDKRQKVNTPAPDNAGPAVRYYLLRAQVEALIRGDSGIAPSVSFLVKDAPEGTQRPSYLRKKETVLLFARPGSKAGDIQLVSRNAIQPWHAELEANVRAVTAELLKADSAPSITGIGDAFHIAGTVAGEGETQIFLKTSTGAPVSLSIMRRPGQTPRWGVSLGEIVDESAAPPAPRTLLWYRLACGLPANLPPESTRTLPLIDAEAARQDYKLVIESLGSCGRTL